MFISTAACACSAIGRAAASRWRQPAGRAGGDAEGVTPAQDERERAEDHVVEEAQEHPRLEVADPVGHAGPPAPGGAGRGLHPVLRCGSGSRRHSRSLAQPPEPPRTEVLLEPPPEGIRLNPWSHCGEWHTATALDLPSPGGRREGGGEDPGTRGGPRGASLTADGKPALRRVGSAASADRHAHSRCRRRHANIASFRGRLLLS